MCDCAHDETEVNSWIQAPDTFQRQAQFARIPLVLLLSLCSSLLVLLQPSEINRQLRAEYPLHYRCHLLRPALLQDDT